LPARLLAYLVEYEDSEKLLKFVERRKANDDEIRLGTYGNRIWFDCRTMRDSLRCSPNHFMLCVRMISHHRRGDTCSRTRIGRSKDVCTVGRMPAVLKRIVYTSQATPLTVSII
jgi:hypothetical protein